MMNGHKTQCTQDVCTGPYSTLHPFNGLNQHQKGKPFLILLEQEMMGWQWHQLDHMQIIGTLIQTDNHASTSPLSFFKGRMPFLPPNQQRQSTEGIQCLIMYVTIISKALKLERANERSHSFI